MKQACFIAQGGGIEDLPNDTSANQDSGSAVSASNRNQQPAEPPTSNVPDNASNVPAVAYSSNATMLQVLPLQIRPSDYIPLNPLMITKFGSLAIGRCKGSWEKIDHSNVGPGRDMEMGLRLHKMWKNPRTGYHCQSPCSAYSHMSLACHRKHNTTIEPQDFMITNEGFLTLKDENQSYLQELGFLEYILANKEKSEHQ